MFPAMVLPAASAISPTVDVPRWERAGRKRATKGGTFEMNWETTTPVATMTGTAPRSSELPSTSGWKNPDCQTLAMRTKRPAKNASVGQSIRRRISNRRPLPARMGGMAATAAIQVSGISRPGMSVTAAILTAIMMTSRMSERRARAARPGSQIVSCGEPAGRWS